MFTTFKSRLLGIVLVINFCVLALGVTSYYFIGSLGGRLDTFTLGIFHRLEIANQLRESADARAIAVRNLALLKDPTLHAQALQEFDHRQKDTQKSLRELQDAVATAQVPPDISQRVLKIAEIESRYAPLAQSIVSKIEEGKIDEATADIQSVCTPTLISLSEALRDYKEVTDQRTLSFVSETSHTTAWQKVAMLVTALASLSIAAILGYLLQRNVLGTFGAEPERLKDYVGELADGNLAAKSGRAPDDTMSIMSAIEKMQHKMREVVEKVRATSNAISQNSSEIASGNADLSSRTEHQSSNLQRTASAMEQMTRSVQHNAVSARSASDLATSVSAAATGGSDVMLRVTETMSSISQSSARIGDIIGVIDSIAFQTNILALNAAVEAARAGDQGRGFAVVAAEVRTLAQRSAEAAREIKTLVTASVERVDAGSDLVSEAGRAVGNIVSEVQRVATLIQDIGQSVQEQSSGIAQVSASVSTLDQSTQQNAALAEQSAAAAESLRLQSAQLTKAVDYFHV